MRQLREQGHTASFRGCPYLSAALKNKQEAQNRRDELKNITNPRRQLNNYRTVNAVGRSFAGITSENLTPNDRQTYNRRSLRATQSREPQNTSSNRQGVSQTTYPNAQHTQNSNTKEYDRLEGLLESFKEAIIMELTISTSKLENKIEENARNIDFILNNFHKGG